MIKKELLASLVQTHFKRIVVRTILYDCAIMWYKGALSGYLETL